MQNHPNRAFVDEIWAQPGARSANDLRVAVAHRWPS